MDPQRTVQVTISVDADLLAQVGAPEDLSDFVNAALRSVRDLQRQQNQSETDQPKGSPQDRPVQSESEAFADLPTDLKAAAAQQAADAAEEAAETAKWDTYLS